MRYRCQVACPSTGMTMMRPRNAGIDPIIRPPATIRPQTAIGPGLAVTALIEVKAHRRDRADKGEAGRERKQQRQSFVAEC